MRKLLIAGLLVSFGLSSAVSAQEREEARLLLATQTLEEVAALVAVGEPGVLQAEQSQNARVQVVQVDAEKNLLLVKGAVPGSEGGNVIVRPAARG